ncbi:MAG: peptidoglycan bridge formation glycyltransferase FemA/FemB family protein [Chloroflexi bacterium]|nr:peptidoglycan bridge formation glycyltransferase FemA/FemB family protein [Chloroflexota bacterium]
MAEVEVKLASPGDRDLWNGFIASCATGHILQSFEWGEFKAAYGWTPIRLLFVREGQIVAAASMLKRAAGPVAMCYAPRGPVLDYADQPLLDIVLDTMATVARRQHAIYLKIDPDVRLEDDAIRRIFRRHGYVPGEPIQRPNTMMLDISGSEDDVLGRMKPKWRYNIRLAEKKGVEIVEGTPADYPDFYRVYKETGERDCFIIRPYDYCELEWRSFMEAGLATFYLAKYGGQTLAGIMPFALGRRMWYFFGASSNLHRNLMPNHLLQWRAIQWARERGCTEYDMWGIPDVLEEGQPLWGVYLFKQGFGAEVVRWSGAYDRVLNRPLYELWTRGVPAYLRVLRRLRGERTDERQLPGV